MDYRPSVKEHLESWRQGAAHVGRCLEEPKEIHWRKAFRLLRYSLALLLLPAAVALADVATPTSPPQTEGNHMPDPVSSNGGSPVTRHNPPTLLDSTEIGLSQISVAEPGRTAFLSGQTATPRDRGAIPRDLAGQARVVAGNLAAALKELGASPRDVVLLRVYVVGATTDRFMEAWSPIRDMLIGAKPTMTGIGVQALWTPEMQLEVEMVVRVP